MAEIPRLLPATFLTKQQIEEMAYRNLLKNWAKGDPALAREGLAMLHEALVDIGMAIKEEKQ